MLVVSAVTDFIIGCRATQRRILKAHRSSACHSLLHRIILGLNCYFLGVGDGIILIATILLFVGLYDCFCVISAMIFGISALRRNIAQGHASAHGNGPSLAIILGQKCQRRSVFRANAVEGNASRISAHSISQLVFRPAEACCNALFTCFHAHLACHGHEAGGAAALY